MTNNRREINQPVNYKIKVKGSFDEAWLAYWFEGFVVTQQTFGETTLTGPVADEAALHGLLAKVRDLGLKLLLLERMENQTK
jgi:hypothetical protein